MPDWLQIYIVINVFIIGTLFGSFFTLATYRIPRKQDIVFKRSYCPNCNHGLGFFDLVPILSYMFLLGKCRYCKNKINLRYPLFEVANGLVFVLIYMLFGFEKYFFIACAIYIYLFLLTGSYIMKRKIIKSEIIKLNNDECLSPKKGVFILEIVIAFVLFAIFITSSYLTSRNYLNQSINTIARSDAMAICIKNIEIALATDYDSLNSFINTETVDGITYVTSISVYKYSDEYRNKEDYIKKIDADVEYILDGKTYNFKIDTLKKKVVG